MVAQRHVPLARGEDGRTREAPNSMLRSYYQHVVTRILEAAERVLDELRPIAEQLERRIEFAALEGRPAEVLIRAAELRDADEIVVGCRGLGRLRGALGSVSQELLRDAACPVTVVSRDAAAQGSTSPRRIA